MVPPSVTGLQRDFYNNYGATVTFDEQPVGHKPADGFEETIADFFAANVPGINTLQSGAASPETPLPEWLDT